MKFLSSVKGFIGNTSKKIASCTKIAKGEVLKSDDYSVMFASNPESLNTDKPVIALASTPEIAEKCVCATITLKKASAAKISAEDITLVEGSANAKVVNNIPVIQVVTTTQKPAETTTKAPETTTKAPETTTKAPETTTKAPETTTKAEVETTTEAEVETTTEAEVETTTRYDEIKKNLDDETTTEATVGTTAVVEDGTTEEAVVVNPNTGDSATASAAIVALLAVSGAAVVALRKKEN